MTTEQELPRKNVTVSGLRREIKRERLTVEGPFPTA